MRVYVAGLGLSEGGHFSIEVFAEANDARDYVEELLEDHPGERKWSSEKVIGHDVENSSLTDEGERLYYGFEHDTKGFIMEKEVTE